MGKFGIGARVRDEDGDEGLIVGKRKGERLVRYGADLLGIEFWLTKSLLTPIAPAEQRQGETLASDPEWQPKVGDRVRVVKHRNWFGDVLNYIEPGSEVELTGLLDDGDFEVPEGETWTAFTTNTQYWIRSDDIEPLPVAAEAQGEGNLDDDVTTIFDDLVSEWPSDEVAVSPATATPAEPAPKFKVGDRVNWVRAPRFANSIIEANCGFFDFKIRAQNGEVTYVFESELEPADTPVSAGGTSAGTIRPDTFANLRVKVASINGQKANVIIPGLRNPSHGVPLSELST